MSSIKFLLVVLLLIFSAQSQALFMPVSQMLSADEVVEFNDVGC